MIQIIVRKRRHRNCGFLGQLWTRRKLLFWRNYIETLWPIPSSILDNHAMKIQNSIFYFRICENVGRKIMISFLVSYKVIENNHQLSFIIHQIKSHYFLIEIYICIILENIILIYDLISSRIL